MTFVSTAVGNTSEDTNPYAVISDKNVFHLNPPPPPAPAEAAKPPDLQKVMLSGFQKVGDRMKVYLAIPAKDPKDTAYLALQAGEKQRDVEIIKIRAEKQEVDILNSGTRMTLSIASNGFALTGGAGAGKPAAAGPPGPGGRRIPVVPGTFPAILPTAGAPRPAAGGNSAIIVGGGYNSGSSSYGASSASYGGNAFVTGGAPPMAATAPIPNSPSAQIANTLLSGGATGQGYRMPAPENLAPAPPVVQAAGLLINQAAGGPPAPTGIEEPEGGPPGPER